MTDGYNHERCFVAIICRKLKEKGLKHAPVSRIAFPDRKSPANTWRSIRNFEKPGLPQRLALGEAVALAGIVNEPLHALLLEVDYAIKNGWHYEKDDPSPDC